MNVDKRLKELKKKVDRIEYERIYGKGTRYDKQEQADGRALNIYLNGDVDWLISQLKAEREEKERYKKALEGIDPKVLEAMKETFRKYDETLKALKDK